MLYLYPELTQSIRIMGERYLCLFQHIIVRSHIRKDENLRFADFFLTMDSSFAVIEDRSNSPDSSSHALNRHDTVDPEGEYLIGNFDDDIDFESFTDDSENVEFDDLPEDTEFNFQSMLYRCLIEYATSLPRSPADFSAFLADADDGLSGVEIEFSLGDSEDILQEDGNENEVESHEPQAQPIQPARPSVGRIQGI